jgi:hypothetical protein
MPSRRVLIAGLVAFLLVSACGALLVSMGIARMNRLLFGVERMPSTSMEPYDIVLRRAGKAQDGQGAGEHASEWRLTVPRAFVDQQVGENGATSGPDIGEAWWSDFSDEENSFYVSLGSVVDPASARLAPSILAEPPRLKDEYMSITLSNRSMFPAVVAADYCIRDDDYDPAVMQAGAPVRWKQCAAATPRCDIHTTFEGWDIRLGVSRAIYERPQDACTAARRFLLEKTVRHDGAPVRD